MFGYVRPRKDQLKICDYDRYRAAYCGLCRALGKQYGLVYRFFVNYDMTFLYFLLAGIYPEEKREKCICPANIFRKKQCYCTAAVYEEVAALDVILCHRQLSDAVQDRSLLRGLPYRAARALTRRGYRKAAKKLPEFDRLTTKQLEKLSGLELAGCASIDEASDSFAAILRGCAAGVTPDAVRRPMEQVLYHVGRFLYLTDALDDLSEDCRQDSYNPLRYRFRVENGCMEEEDRKQLLQTIDGSVTLAGAALELLPLKSGAAILRNIIYLGLPAVLRSVSDGSFRARGRI